MADCEAPAVRYFWDWTLQWFVQWGEEIVGPLPDEESCRLMLERLALEVDGGL